MDATDGMSGYLSSILFTFSTNARTVSSLSVGLSVVRSMQLNIFFRVSLSPPERISFLAFSMTDFTHAESTFMLYLLKAWLNLSVVGSFTWFCSKSS